jgi:hypothetical protein
VEDQSKFVTRVHCMAFAFRDLYLGRDRKRIGWTVRKKAINTIIDPLLIAKMHTFAADYFVSTLFNLGVYCVTIHGVSHKYHPFTVPGTQNDDWATRNSAALSSSSAIIEIVVY